MNHGEKQRLCVGGGDFELWKENRIKISLYSRTTCDKFRLYSKGYINLPIWHVTVKG